MTSCCSWSHGLELNGREYDLELAIVCNYLMEYGQRGKVCDVVEVEWRWLPCLIYVVDIAGVNVPDEVGRWSYCCERRVSYQLIWCGVVVVIVESC
jgi:hypothetical protein